MVKVGVLGLGFMGQMHFNTYKAYRRAKVTAICDGDPKKLAGDWGVAGNIEDTRAEPVDLSGIAAYAKPAALFADPNVDVVDITLPTFLHAKHAIAALKAGKHVICEKPLALTVADCEKVIAAAKKAKRLLMVAHCIRFWPEWVVLKKLIDSKRYGKVLSASFWRKSLTPTWSWNAWLMADQRSGGAVLDLHIHDTDFINYAFGIPKAVRSTGVIGGVTKSAIDHVVTQYIYPRGPQITAEGGWAMAPGFGFTHGFCVIFEKATVEHDAKSGLPLTVHTTAGKTLTPKVPAGDGYIAELRHFVDCVAKGTKPTVVTPQAARDAVKVCLAEAKSVKTGREVKVR
ncbi:Gfo/Idh/MocA family protein [Planctomycetota bacterium]